MIKVFGAAVLVIAAAFVVLTLFTLALRVWWPDKDHWDALLTLAGIAIMGWTWRGSRWDDAGRRD